MRQVIYTGRHSLVSICYGDIGTVMEDDEDSVRVLWHGADKLLWVPTDHTSEYTGQDLKRYSVVVVDVGHAEIEVTALSKEAAIECTKYDLEHGRVTLSHSCVSVIALEVKE